MATFTNLVGSLAEQKRKAMLQGRPLSESATRGALAGSFGDVTRPRLVQSEPVSQQSSQLSLGSPALALAEQKQAENERIGLQQQDFMGPKQEVPWGSLHGDAAQEAFGKPELTGNYANEYSLSPASDLGQQLSATGLPIGEISEPINTEYFSDIGSLVGGQLFPGGIGSLVGKGVGWLAGRATDIYGGWTAPAAGASWIESVFGDRYAQYGIDSESGFAHELSGVVGGGSGGDVTGGFGWW